MIGTTLKANQLAMITVGLSLLIVPVGFKAIQKEMCKRDRAMLCGPRVPKGLCNLEDYIDQLSPACKSLILGKQAKRALKKKTS